MKYCLNSRQPQTYLEKADEILVLYRFHADIIDCIEKYPDKDIILCLVTPKDMEIDWDKIKEYNTMLRGHLICALTNADMVEKCKEIGTRYYFLFSASSWYELQAMKDLGVCYVYLAPPLTHELNKVKLYGVPVRWRPNIAYEKYLPHSDGVNGSWIRPEDVEYYGQYVDTFEFEARDTKHEQALFDIYNRGEWAGPLNMLITGLDYDGLNRMINSEFSQVRANCRQKCVIPGERCNICWNSLKLANAEKIQTYAEQVLGRTPST